MPEPDAPAESSGDPLEHRTAAAGPVTPKKTDSVSIERTPRGTFAPGNSGGRGKPRQHRVSLRHYITQKCGKNGHRLVDTLLNIIDTTTSDSLKIKASEILLERGWGKTAAPQPDITHQPLFTLPPGAHVAIAIKLPDVVPASTTHN